ncbi:6-deoxy-6-sulfogluconolactonase [Paraburkholderia graminis C4D1M]|jgi:sugar lactone lactonase YvrE|uniref:SMP-30/Gluconolaconase/LRE domain protein n=1 Tax=Paraburkholderia graminis (strain ATCC 700544 / DSM 17151 / LMG 18924 / NCIMB 13744 / C4D1M) TaxID=396598 RepID=B1G8V7_PARG4|nr:SMP-30/gluconolactonase/LRE family protein [Paraburkholderia graminis]EDT07428.1 SMP-30/Gluconolaconase/LRE domain protein [Paraburkholderia graminis C4D1M]CAB3725860.1 6-deoxy-6-sulfogluconolactonase [Paraburkholderia graminis C4D1M]
MSAAGNPRVERVERVEAAGPVPAAVGESPVWRAAEQALYWVDIPAQKIVRLRLESGERSEWLLPEKVACIAFDRRGNVLAGCETGLFAVTLSDASAPLATQAEPVKVSGRKLAAPVFPFGDMRFNDGRCDRQGRFWAGTMVQDMAAANPAGALYRLDADGVLSAPVVDGLITQNGLGWSPDGSTMYLSDSHPLRRQIWAFDYDVETGEPRNRRVFADLNHYVGRPDGAAVDADGCYWICANDAGALLRFTPQGKLDRQINVPAIKPAMCAFGGRDLDTLFVTSIRPAAGASEHDGHLFAVRPGVSGLPEPEFAGDL